MKHNNSATLDFISRYNISVFLMYIALLAIYITKIPYPADTKNLLLFVVANTAGIAIIYLYNKITDTKEDSILGITISEKNRKKLWVIIALLFALSSSIYISLVSPIVVISGALMFILGALYSGVFGMRAKKYFGVKNIIPPTLWYISFVVFGYVVYSLSLPLLLYIFYPVFFLSLMFEIIWDMPDEESDRHAGTKTLPVVLGFEKTRVIVLCYIGALLYFIPKLEIKLFLVGISLVVLYVQKTTRKHTYHICLVCLAVLLLFFNFIT